MTTLASPAQPARLLSHTPFLLFFAGCGCATFASQMAVVAIGWQVYALTGSAYYLGLAGLVEFLPTVLFIFLAGHVADRLDRTRVLLACQLVKAATAAVLAIGSFAGWVTPTDIFCGLALLGTAAAFESPAAAALLPGVVPESTLPRATALTSGMFQAASICAPALGGLAYAVAPSAPYLLMTGLWLAAAALNGALTLERPVMGREPPTLAAMFAGIGFVRRDPAILGTISLDLFAVLLGGATALLPIYARDILHTGPWGLGILRGAGAVGALAMGAWLARHAITRHTGLRMFQAVIVFGLATVAFALSRDFWLSLLALAVMGAADMVSVVIRVSLVQLRTPDEMRGRVGAVNYLFINASNELGEFESGMTAWLWGAMPAAVVGGIGTVLVALAWMRLFPDLARLDRLDDGRPG